MKANCVDNRIEKFLRSIPEPYRELKHWPVVDEQTVADDKVPRLRSLTKAADLFLKRQPLKDVLSAAKTSERQFFRLMRSALNSRKGADEVNGTRAFVKGMVQRTRRRTMPFGGSGSANPGFGGLFGQLLQDVPEIETELVTFLNGKERPNKITPRVLHVKFQAIATASGIQPHQYPFNTKSKGYKPLMKWYEQVYMPKYLLHHVRKQHGKAAAVAAAFQTGDGKSNTPPPLFSAWVIDAYRDDIEATVDVPSPRWGVEEAAMDCIQVLNCRSIGSVACNLAWHACLQAQASGEDLIQLIKNAILGQPAVAIVDPNMKYEKGAGFPANIFPACRYAVPVIVYLDNALAHLKDALQHVLTRLCGARVVLGKPGTPKGRPDIESSNAHLLRQLIHQLPFTRGTGPLDPVREASSIGPRRVPLALLLQALDVYYANQNVMPSAGAGYLDSFTRLSRMIESGALKVAHLTEEKRRPHFFCDPKPVVVHCDLNSGRLPHVNFLHRRYSSPWLKMQPALNGKRFWALCDYDDLRTIVLADDTMATFAIVACEGQWGLVPHDMRLIKIFARHKADAQFKSRPNDIPLFSILARLSEKAKDSTGAATDFAYVMHYLKRHLPPQEMKQIQNGEFNESSIPLLEQSRDELMGDSTDSANSDRSLPPPHVVASITLSGFQAPRRLS
jgi:putative transposase